LLILPITLAACGGQPDPSYATAMRDENLFKLGKVWGFTKYTHNSFISGALDWDRELLNLIPIIYDSDAEYVNGILYDWFIGLGEDGFDFEPNIGNYRPMADMSWINEDYLGALAARLLRFGGVNLSERGNAPVFFDPYIGTPNFSNQQLHTHMDYEDPGYRLLGLFRLWNAVNYYFPHLDVLDVQWNDLLAEFVPRMLAVTDRLSYELTIAAMARHMHDAHVRFTGTMIHHVELFGPHMVPALFVAAEGYIVVYQGLYPLQTGDVIRSINGRDIDEIVEEARQYLSYPNDEKLLAYFTRRHRMLRSRTRDINIGVRRGGVEMTLAAEGTFQEIRNISTAISHELLDNNIGLINFEYANDIHGIMREFATTDGLIIDLRQPPHPDFVFLDLRQYFMEEPLPFAYVSMPSNTHPGERFDTIINQYIPRSPYAFTYERPVAVLINEVTMSHLEWVTMALRTAPNVTVIGPFSMGSNGNTTSLPLPGGITIFFTSLGVYTPEGGQTHRIGLTPDIRVDPSVEGIKEGRDEIMEAAIRFILGYV